MKIEPELVNHPKYLLLRKKVGPEALEYLIRLWGHCEANKRGELWRGVDAAYVEVVCQWRKAAGVLFGHLVEIGWVKVEDGAVRIHDWEITNWRRVTNWNLGSRTKHKGKASEKPRLMPEHEPQRSPLNDMNELSDMNDVRAAVIPSEQEVLVAAKNYQGDLARGIPAEIPEGWALNWLAWRMSPSAGPFPDDWIKDLHLRFRAGWINGDPRTGRKIEKKPGFVAGDISASVAAIEQQKKTAAWRTELRDLEQEIEALVQAGAAVPAEKTARERELRKLVSD